MSLTLRAIFVTAMLALAGVVGQWSPAPGSSLVWRFGAAAMLIALVYEAWKTRLLHLEITASARPAVHLNRRESFTLTFKKDNEEPVNLQYRFSPQSNFRLPDDVCTLKISTQCHTQTQWFTPLSLGEHHLPPVTVRVLGPFGLVWWKRKQGLDVSFRVGPASLGRAGANRSRSGVGELASAPVGSGLELRCLRDYRPGDPRRSIDWKATAKVRRLITREWTEDQHLEVMIAIDASRTSRIRVDGLSRLGHFANIAASLSEIAVRNDDKVGVLVFADEPVSMVLPARGIAAVTRIRQVLTTVETRPVESSPLSAMLQLRQRLRHRCLIIVMSDLDEQNAAGQLSQSVQLLMPKHSTLIIDLENVAVSRLSTADAENRLDPYTSVAASEYLLNRHAGIRQLRRRGCPVVTAPPEHLARKALNSYQTLRQHHRV